MAENQVPGQPYQQPSYQQQPSYPQTPYQQQPSYQQPSYQQPSYQQPYQGASPQQQPYQQAPYQQAPYQQQGSYQQAPYAGSPSQQQPPYTTPQSQQQPPYATGQQPPPYGAAPYQTVSPDQREIWETKGRRAIGFGVVWLVAGLLITIITYSAASGGGVYVVAWGPALYGAYRIFSGFRLLNKARN